MTKMAGGDYRPIGDYALNIERAEARGAEMRAETASERAEEIEDSRRR